MVRVFYTQKTVQLFKKLELKHWQELSNKILGKKHQDLSDDWKICVITERIQLERRDLKDLKDLTPEAIKLGYDFSVTMEKHDNQKAFEILTKIKQLDTIWRAE